MYRQERNQEEDGGDASSVEHRMERTALRAGYLLPVISARLTFPPSPLHVACPYTLAVLPHSTSCPCYDFLFPSPLITMCPPAARTCIPRPLGSYGSPPIVQLYHRHTHHTHIPTLIPTTCPSAPGVRRDTYTHVMSLDCCVVFIQPLVLCAPIHLRAQTVRLKLARRSRPNVANSGRLPYF